MLDLSRFDLSKQALLPRAKNNAQGPQTASQGVMAPDLPSDKLRLNKQPIAANPANADRQVFTQPALAFWAHGKGNCEQPHDQRNKRHRDAGMKVDLIVLGIEAGVFVSLDEGAQLFKPQRVDLVLDFEEVLGCFRKVSGAFR